MPIETTIRILQQATDESRLATKCDMVARNRFDKSLLLEYAVVQFFFADTTLYTIL